VGHGGDVTAVAFSPDGRRVATGGADATVRLWDASTGAVLQVFLGHEGTVRHVRFGPRDDVLTSLAGDGVRRWSAAPDASVLRFHRSAEEGNPHPYVYAAEFSPDGQRLATAGWDGTVRVVEAATGERLLTIETGESSVRDVRWTPDGRCLVGGHDRVARWDAFTGEELAAWKGTGTDSVAITPDGTQVVTGDSGGRLRLHRITDLEPVSTWKAQSLEVFDLAVSPDGSRVASISLRGLVVVLDRATGAQRWRRQVHPSAPFGAVAFSPDGRRLATGGGDRTVRILDAATGDEIRVLRGHNDAVYGLAWTPDGTRLLSGSNDATLRVWDPDAGQQRLELRGHGSYVYRVAVSPDGATVATASGDETARTWSAVPVAERERRARAARSARADADALVDARLAAGAAPRDLADEWLRDSSADDALRTARLHALMRRVDRDRAPRRKSGD
jgi:WD40 repeat protein